MGIFKNVRQMKEAVAGAPGMIEQAQQLQAAAQQHAAAAAASGAPAGGIGSDTAAVPAPGELGDADLAPIGGVDLELYAELSREIGARGASLSEAPALAAERGIAAADWQAAVDGWNQRMAANPAVAVQFNRLYQGG